mmetsp:Transcript_3026/g.8533  ORF Transcript_3026/g.8533 Transcript_3026/m.8533 type:complete len:229 (-) Transcript_3026:638-1324(-)
MASRLRRVRPARSCGVPRCALTRGTRLSGTSRHQSGIARGRRGHSTGRGTTATGRRPSGLPCHAARARARRAPSCAARVRRPPGERLAIPHALGAWLRAGPLSRSRSRRSSRSSSNCRTLLPRSVVSRSTRSSNAERPPRPWPCPALPAPPAAAPAAASGWSAGFAIAAASPESFRPEPSKGRTSVICTFEAIGSSSSWSALFSLTEKPMGSDTFTVEERASSKSGCV